MSRFASTVSYYERFRQPYPAEFFRTVAAELAITPARSLIDLGTGPGLIALGFAPFAGKVVGVDPEPAMLELARQAVALAGRPVVLIEGTAETLPPDIGPFDVVTIGRALHWMDPAPTRKILDRLVAPGGAILVCASSTARDAENPWAEIYDAIRRRWVGGDAARRSRVDLPAFFAGTRFAVGRRIAVRTRHRLSVDDLAQRVLSFSSSSPAILGDRADAMLAEVRAALLPFGDDGWIEETLETSATVIG
jgi:SAM-dependent methyltransferase